METATKPKHQDDGVQLPTRYQCYMFAKRYLGGECAGKVFPVGENNEGHSGEDKLCDRQQLLQGGNIKRLSNEEASSISIAGGQDKQDGRHKPNDTDSRGGQTYSIRRLTPTECERLQGFPDGWTEGVSDTQRYKCLGNAVTVNVIEFLIGRLL